MLILERIGCRLLQAAFHAVLPLRPYREPAVFYERISEYPEMEEVI